MLSFFEGLADRFDGALGIGLEHDVQLLHIALLDLAEEVFERYLRAAGDFLHVFLLGALFSNLFCQTFVGDDDKIVPRLPAHR